MAGRYSYYGYVIYREDVIIDGGSRKRWVAYRPFEGVPVCESRTLAGAVAAVDTDLFRRGA